MGTTSLNRIVLKGFRSIREMELELKPINLLIGANGAGKSNFLSFFRFMREVIQRNLQRHVLQIGGADRVLHFGRKRTAAAQVRLDFSDCAYHAEFGSTTDNRLVLSQEQWYSPDIPENASVWTFDSIESSLGLASTETVNRRVAVRLNGWRIYHFHDTTPEAKVKSTGRIDQTGSLYSDASNLAAFLLSLRTAPAYGRILATIRRVAPFINDFVLEPEDEAGRYLRLRWSHRNSEQIFDISDLSDGTLRFICLTTLLLQPNPPPIIIIDEPELGLHPAALNILAAMMQSVSAGTQIIASTQSVTLANQFGVDDIIVVDRNDEASTFHRPDAQTLADWLGEYSIGDLWEKNVIGGNP